MFVQLNSIVIDANPANRREMANFLANSGVNVTGQFPALDPLPELLAKPEAPQLVVVNLDPAPNETLKRVGVLARQFPAASFFVLSQVIDAQLIMDAMHLGVKEFVPLPVAEDKFAAGIERIAHHYGMGRRARIIHVIPTMGGCGSTTVACNLAASLAPRGKTVLIDMDLLRGAVASSFDLRPRYTIADVMDSGERLDPQLLDNALATHPASGLAILARPELPEDTHRINQPGFARLLNVLGRMYDHVVIDSLMSISPLYATALQAADMNLLVMQLNVPSVKNTERFVGALRRMGIEPGKIQLVANRFVKKGADIDPEEAERALNMKIAWLIPNDFKNAIGAINFGEPVVLRAPRAEISTALSALAETFLQPMKAAA